MSAHGYLMDLAVLVDDATDAGLLLRYFVCERPGATYVLAPGRADVSPGEHLGQLEVTVHSALVSDPELALKAARIWGEVIRHSAEAYDPTADVPRQPAPAEACTDLDDDDEVDWAWESEAPLAPEALGEPACTGECRSAPGALDDYLAQNPGL